MVATLVLTTILLLFESDISVCSICVIWESNAWRISLLVCFHFMHANSSSLSSPFSASITLPLQAKTRLFHESYPPLTDVTPPIIGLFFWFLLLIGLFVLVIFLPITCASGASHVGKSRIVCSGVCCVHACLCPQKKMKEKQLNIDWCNLVEIRIVMNHRNDYIQVKSNPDL